jgi:hypothetical protein
MVPVGVVDADELGRAFGEILREPAAAGRLRPDEKQTRMP